MDDRAVEIQKELFLGDRSRLERYSDLVVGRRGFAPLLKYELIISLAANRPGALGLVLRSWLYPRLLDRCGRNVTFGSHVVLRHPHKISIGDNVVIDDQCVLDAKGTDNEGIRIGSGVFIGRNTILSCKNGDIVLGDHVNIGFNSEIFSASRVEQRADLPWDRGWRRLMVGRRREGPGRRDDWGARDRRDRGGRDRERPRADHCGRRPGPRAEDATVRRRTGRVDVNPGPPHV